MNIDLYRQKSVCEHNINKVSFDNWQVDVFQFANWQLIRTIRLVLGPYTILLLGSFFHIIA